MASALSPKDGTADRLKRTPSLCELFQKPFAELEVAVGTANQHRARSEQIKRSHAIGKERLPGGEEPTMTLGRAPISRTYAHEIERLDS